MENVRWEFIIPAILAGGVVGALITGLFQKRKAQFHPIGLKVDANPVFPPSERSGPSEAKVVLKYNEVTFLASKVFIVDLQLVNLGDRDFPEFKFNISLPSDHNIIASICEPPDHAHAIENTPAVTPESWAKEMGFTLRPFNARDSYALRLYIHVGTTSKEVTHIVPTTEESVRFIDMPAISKQLEEAVRLLGPVPFD